MNIVFICSEYPYKKTQATGGFGRCVETISPGLVKLGHRVEVVCKSEKYERPLLRTGVNVRPVPISKPKLLDKLAHFSSISRIISFIGYPILWSWTVKEVIKKIDKENSIDIIEGGDFGGELFFYLLFPHRSIPVIIKLHTPSFVIQKYNTEPNNMFYRIMDYLESFCIRKASSLNSPTKDLALIVSKKYKVKIKDIIPYPIQDIKINKNINRMSQTILYVGKLQVKKGVFTVLQAIPAVVSKYPDSKFIFIGPDTMLNGKSTKKDMLSYLRKYNLAKNVNFYNEMSKSKLFTFYQKATLTVVPSFWENFPNVLLEAMCCGSLIIASKVGGIPEIIRNRIDGILLEEKNHTLLSLWICRVLEDPNKYIYMKKNSYTRLSTTYDISTVSQKTLKFYKYVVKRF